jgi:hypothetical protein
LKCKSSNTTKFFVSFLVSSSSVQFPVVGLSSHTLIVRQLENAATRNFAAILDSAATRDRAAILDCAAILDRAATSDISKQQTNGYVQVRETDKSRTKKRLED